MQATLLGLSVAIILALVAALVGPHFVDWTQYRARFEREATRLAGIPVRIGGTIDVRLLPTPTIALGRVEIGNATQPQAKAREVYAELALGALMRGRFARPNYGGRAGRVARRHGKRARRVAGHARGLRSRSVPDRQGCDRGRAALALRDGASGTTVSLAGLLVQRRTALAARAGEGRRRVHLGRRALRLSTRSEPRRRRRRSSCALVSIRRIVRSRSKPTARCGSKKAPRASRAR